VQDEDTRHQLDQDFDAIRSLLFTREDMDAETTTEDSTTALGPDMSKPPPTVGDDYDQLVRELVYDKHSQPKDQTKTEEEIVQEEKEVLEKAERARLRASKMRRQMKRMKGGNDHVVVEGDEDEGWAGIGTRLRIANTPQASYGDEDGRTLS